MFSTESDFLQFAFSKYDNPHLSSLQEFESDLKRFHYVNVLCNRYRADRLDIQDRLIINHLIILSNCFTVPGLLKMIPYKTKSENKITLDTFCYYLNFIDHADVLDFYLLDIINE